MEWFDALNLRRLELFTGREASRQPPKAYELLSIYIYIYIYTNESINYVLNIYQQIKSSFF